jgi:hypothetical protein
MLAFDLHGRKSRRQRAGGHDVLRSNFLAELPELEIVEISEIARGHADRADAEPRFQIVDAIEVDQPLQRLLQRRGVVIALRLPASGWPQRRRRNARREEARHAEGRDQRG